MGNKSSSRGARSSFSGQRSPSGSSAAAGASSPSGAGGGSSGSSSTLRRTPNRNGGVSVRNSTRGGGQPAPAPASSPVRCPRCRRLLQPPSGADRFLCPCGQMLQAPNPAAQRQRLQQQQQQQQRSGAVTHVRCPNCSVTLQPPVDAAGNPVPVFRCPCGTHLRSPVVNNVSTRALVSAPDPNEAVLSGQDATHSQVVASLMQLRAQEQWMRVAGADGRSLEWKNLQSDEENQRKIDMEQRCLGNLKDNAARLTTEELYSKLEALGLSTDDCEEKQDLQEKLEHAPELLERLGGAQLMRQLDALEVVYDDVEEDEELAVRLLTAVWFDGLYDDGYVANAGRDGALDWISAGKARLEVSPLQPDMLVQMSAQPFARKLKWFREQLTKMRIPWEEGRVQIKVRRQEILRDSFTNLNKLTAQDLHRYFRFEFVGEPGIDAGGVAREFFQLLADSLFNVDFGLFEYSGVDNVSYQINPSSGIANELHLKYFYFLGRVMAKALFDGHVLGAHLVRPIYKYLLGAPVGNTDVEYIDPQVHRSIKDIRDVDDEYVEHLCLDFTTATKVFGEVVTIDLIENGADTEVTPQNRERYLNLLIKHILFDRVSPQLSMLLRGFSEVIPAHLMCIFDHLELELLLCGLPTINVADWKANSMYRGAYAAKGAKHSVVAWFWETIAEFDQEQKAKFLQFATGSARVPVQGFGALQGSDGSIKPFTIDSLKFEKSVFPRSHTCFNRIELPNYPSKALLKRYVLQALSLEGVGFADE